MPDLYLIAPQRRHRLRRRAHLPPPDPPDPPSRSPPCRPAARPPQQPSPRQVTPLQLLAGAGGALTAGALLGGMGHYYSTAKGLAEEGIDPRTRLRALPLAVSRRCSLMLRRTSPAVAAPLPSRCQCPPGWSRHPDQHSFNLDGRPRRLRWAAQRALLPARWELSHGSCLDSNTKRWRRLAASATLLL